MSETASTILRLAVYARVSTEEQRDGQTIDSQFSELERFSREKRWPIVGTYKDDGWSGAVMERPELDRLRDDAQKGLFDAVLVNDVDRLARDVSHLGVIKRDLERRGVQVIFRKLTPDTSPTYNLMVNILGSFAEFEREMIADRMRRGRRHKIEVNKQYLGSKPAFGYRYVCKDKSAGKEGFLVVIPDEAHIVQEMFRCVDEDGLSATRVIKRLNDLKLKPQKGGRWGKSSVLRTLRNEMYAGIWHYGKLQACEPSRPNAVSHYRKRSKSSNRLRPRRDWIPLPLPASLQLVGRKRWQRVQEQLDRNRAFSPRNEKHIYLLKGLVRCGACGAPYVGDPKRGTFFYRCSRRCKKMRGITEKTLNQAIQGSVAEAMMNPDLILGPLRELEAARTAKVQKRRDVAANIEKELQRIEHEEQLLLDAYRIGVISPSQLAPQIEKLKARRIASEVRQKVEPKIEVPLAEAEVVVPDYCAQVAKRLATFTDEQWREFLRTIIRTIEFYGDHVTIQGRIVLPDSGPGNAIAFQKSSHVKVPVNRSPNWA